MSRHGKERGKERVGRVKSRRGDVNAMCGTTTRELIGSSAPPSCERAVCTREELELPGRSIR